MLQSSFRFAKIGVVYRRSYYSFVGRGPPRALGGGFRVTRSGWWIGAPWRRASLAWKFDREAERAWAL